MPKFIIENTTPDNHQIHKINQETLNVPPSGLLAIDSSEIYTHEKERLSKFFKFSEVKEESKTQGKKTVKKETDVSI